MSVLFGINAEGADIFFTEDMTMKITIKLLSAVIALCVLCSIMSVAALADTDSEITVHFSLLGDEVHGEDGKHAGYEYWISYAKYTLPAGSTAYDLFKTAMDDYGYTYDDSYGYVSAVEDLAEMTNGPRSGWMYRINGGFTDSMDKVTLSDGDRMLFFYTDDYNTIDWSGEAQSVNDVIALIDAIGEVTEQSGAAIEKAADAYEKLSDEDKLLVENHCLLVWAQIEYDYIIEQRDLTAAIDTAINTTAEYLINNSSFNVGSIGGDWTVFGIARAGLLDDAHKAKYAANVKKALDENGSETLSATKSTENSRVVLALTAAGYNAADFAGYDLTKPLYDYDFVVKQGANGAIFALLALDSANYAADSGICGKYVDYIISQQMDDGGYSYDGETVDIDLTAMAISALAKHTDSDDAAISVSSALITLASLQNENGGFESYGSECSESTAQALVATAELFGGDSAFSTADMLNAMMKYYNENGGFGHDGTEVNMLSTEQCFYALVACKRAADGENTLYDMTDVTLSVYSVDDNAAEPTESDTDTSNTTADKIETAAEITASGNGGAAASDDPDTGAAGGMGIAFAALAAAAAAIVLAKKRAH